MESHPWETARAAADSAGVEIRPLSRLRDAPEILRVMIATWGEHQLLPQEFIRALQDSGNVPFGAFRRDEMVGYVLGFLGHDGEGVHLHSHMLAVVPGERGKGVGYVLKLAQRAAALARGIRVVRWTFDPLLSRNAHFNIAKLGASADRFERGFYGEMTDLLNRGERTDRLVVRWELDREAGGVAAPEGAQVLRRLGPRERPTPSTVSPPAGGPARVEIPRDYEALRSGDRELAASWRDALAQALEACFAAGLIATGFTSDSAYVFA